jgi:hypothetical protein
MLCFQGDLTRQRALHYRWIYDECHSVLIRMYICYVSYILVPYNVKSEAEETIEHRTYKIIIQSDDDTPIVEIDPWFVWKPNDSLR